MVCKACGSEPGCAAYVRVSTQDQARKGFSLPEQRAQVLQKAGELGYCPQCVDVFEDAHTGAEMDRPGWSRLLGAARRGRYHTIVCLCPDRLGRTTVGMLLAYEELQALGVKVEYVQVHVDETTPEGHLLLQISAVFSDYERRKIAGRIAAGKKRKLRETGRLPHYVRLYGYRFNEETDLLEPDPAEATVVRRIFRWAAYGDGPSRPDGRAGATSPLTPRQIGRRLDGEGIPRADGSSPWHPSTIARMLRRDVYYTGTLWTYRWLDRRRSVPRPEEERYGIPVTPLVDAATWRAANRCLDRRRPRRAGQTGPFLLKGIATCGTCGTALQTVTSRPRGRRFRYYRCPGTGSCPGRYWNADRVEGALWRALIPWLLRWGRRVMEGDGMPEGAEATAAQIRARYEAMVQTGSEAVRRRAVEGLVAGVKLYYPRRIVVAGPFGAEGEAGAGSPEEKSKKKGGKRNL